jgi:hypothetical protein
MSLEVEELEIELEIISKELEMEISRWRSSDTSSIDFEQLERGLGKSVSRRTSC